MKRIIIICEGPTEQSFCKDVLTPYFSPLGIYIENPAIKKTHGGIVNWTALKHQIEKHFLQDKTAYVTTLIDYYGIYEHHEYPYWNEAHKKTDKNKRMDILENGMKENISEEFQARFMPYIQLHEFESILFSDISVFNNDFEPGEFLDYEYLTETIDSYSNPELINNNLETAPSKRLSKIIKNYSKVLYGSLLAYDLGLSKIREKCPRFNDWIIKLENI